MIDYNGVGVFFESLNPIELASAYFLIKTVTSLKLQTRYLILKKSIAFINRCKTIVWKIFKNFAIVCKQNSMAEFNQIYLRKIVILPICTT